MSVYKPRGRETFVYDFWRNKTRYSGDTGQATKRGAERVERSEIAKIEAGVRPDAASEMTLDAAAALWFTEVGQELGSAADCERAIDLLLLCMRPGIRLKDIDAPAVLSAIQARKLIPTEFRSRKGVKTRPPKNATINRQIIEMTRRILRRARLWGATTLREIDWKSLKLPEGGIREREISDDERRKVSAAIGRDYWRDFRDFLGAYGLRLGEMFFDPADVFEVEGQVKVRIRDRKDGSTYTIDLLPADGRLMLARKSRAEAAGFTTIWYREYRPYQRPRKKPRPAPAVRLEPLTYSGARTYLRRAIKRSGVKNLTIHDHRHDVATKAARKHGIAVAQSILGHADISTTRRYVAVSTQDRLAALADVRSQQSPIAKVEAGENSSPNQEAAS